MTKREYEAIASSVLLLRRYLEDNGSTSKQTINASNKLSTLQTKLADWLAGVFRLSEIEFNVVHQAGFEHRDDGFLSRVQTNSAETTPIAHEVPIKFTDVTLRTGKGLKLQKLG